jgi:hypothetical protein
MIQNGLVRANGNWKVKGMGFDKERNIPKEHLNTTEANYGRAVLSLQGSEHRDSSVVLFLVKFQAMTNLLYCFENIAASKDLQEVFDKDLQDLLGLGLNSYYQREDGTHVQHLSQLHCATNPTILERLVSSCLILNHKNPEDYWLKLIPPLFSILRNKVKQIQSGQFASEINQIIEGDIYRAEAWISSTCGRLGPELTSQHVKNMIAFHPTHRFPYAESFERTAKADEYLRQMNKLKRLKKYKDKFPHELEAILYQKRPDLKLD